MNFSESVPLFDSDHHQAPPLNADGVDEERLISEVMNTMAQQSASRITEQLVFQQNFGSIDPMANTFSYGTSADDLQSMFPYNTNQPQGILPMHGSQALQPTAQYSTRQPPTVYQVQQYGMQQPPMLPLHPPLHNGLDLSISFGPSYHPLVGWHYPVSGEFSHPPTLARDSDILLMPAVQPQPTAHTNDAPLPHAQQGASASGKYNGRDSTAVLRAGKRQRLQPTGDTDPRVRKAFAQAVHNEDPGLTPNQKCVCAPKITPRPMNSFLLYRRDEGKKWLSRRGVNFSKVAGAKWHAEPKEVKAMYDALAAQESQRHKQENPGYKFAPGAGKIAVFGSEDCTCGAYEANLEAFEADESMRHYIDDADSDSEPDSPPRKRMNTSNQKSRLGPSRRSNKATNYEELPESDAELPGAFQVEEEGMVTNKSKGKRAAAPTRSIDDDDGDNIVVAPRASTTQVGPAYNTRSTRNTSFAGPAADVEYLGDDQDASTSNNIETVDPSQLMIHNYDSGSDLDAESYADAGLEISYLDFDENAWAEIQEQTSSNRRTSKPSPKDTNNTSADKSSASENQRSLRSSKSRNSSAHSTSAGDKDLRQALNGAGYGLGPDNAQTHGDAAPSSSGTSMTTRSKSKGQL